MPEDVAVPADVIQREMQEEERIIKAREEYNKSVGLDVGVVRGPIRDARFYSSPVDDAYAKMQQERVVSPHDKYPIKVVGADGPNVAATDSSRVLHTQGFVTPDTTVVDDTLDAKSDLPEIVHSGKVVPGAVMVDPIAEDQKPAAKGASVKTPDVKTPSVGGVDPYAAIPDAPK